MLHNKQNHWQAISKTYSTKNRRLYFAQLYSVPEAYSGPCWTSKINCFVKIVNAWKSLIICTKCSFLDFWQGSEYNSEFDTIAFTLNLDFKNSNNGTAWKVSKYEVISGPYFPAFGLNTEIYSVNFQIQSECRKMRTRNNSVFGHFSRSEAHFLIIHVEYIHLWKHK